MPIKSIKEIWTLAEQQNGKLNSVSFELLAWGKKLVVNDNYLLCSIVLTKEIDKEEIHKLIESGADVVYLIQDKKLQRFSVDPYAEVLIKLVNQIHPEIIIASATTTGRSIMPYISAILHGGLTADCTDLEIESESGLLLQTRPAIGGNILATIKTPTHRPQMATVRPKSIALPPIEKDHKGKIIEIGVDLECVNNRCEIIGYKPYEDTAEGVENADVVVAGGKGLHQKNNFYLIENLAEIFSGAVGASRPPVDQGWKPYSSQIGLSGKTISPELYIACGISGSIQHLAGIQTAKTIVAINNDVNAQIFQISDFGIVTDLFEFLPILIRELERS